MKYSRIVLSFFPGSCANVLIQKSGRYGTKYYRNISTSSEIRVNFLIENYTLIYNPHKNFWVYERFN